MDNENKEQDVMTGEVPYDQNPAPDAVEQPQQQEPVVETKPASEPLYFNGRKFNDLQEVSSYMSEMQGRMQALESQVAKPEPEEEISPDQIIFEDPAKAIKLIEERVEKRIYSALDSKDAEKNAWKQFFEANPDLKGQEDLVKFKAQTMWNSLKNERPDVALGKIATEARQMIQKIRGNPTKETVLPSGPAITAGASGSPAARASVQPNAPMSFAEQMRKFQARGRK